MKRIYEDPKERFKVYADKNKEKLLERSRTWNENNREKRNAVSKAWRERNKEQMAECKKASKIKHADTDKNYRQKNKDSIYARTKAWSLANPEKRNETYKKYRKANPEKQLETTSIRRARINGGKIVKFTGKQLQERLSVFGGKCWICGKKADQVDHVIPLAKGGPHILSNLRPACGPCNRKKGASKILKIA